MRDPNDKQKEPDQIYVSAIVANKIISASRPDGFITLVDVGPNGWCTHGGAEIVVTEGEIFVTINFHTARRGAHPVSITVAGPKGEVVHTLRTTTFEIPSVPHSVTFSVPLKGIVLPVGYYWLWVLVGGTRRTGTTLQVARTCDECDPDGV